GQLDDREAARAQERGRVERRRLGRDTIDVGTGRGTRRRRRDEALGQRDRLLQVAHGFVVAAEAGEDAAEREVRARGVGVVRVVGEEALVGDAGLARAAAGFVEARDLERLLRLLVELARFFERAEALAQGGGFGPHAAALVDVGGALLLGRGGALQRFADARGLGEVATIEEQAQIFGLVAALARDVGGVLPVPDALVELLSAGEIAGLARLGGGFAVLALRDERLDVHGRGNMIRTLAHANHRCNRRVGPL